MFNIDIDPMILDKEGTRIFPRNKARVIVKSKKETDYALPEMEYSLIPSWSKEPVVKWTSYNARMDRINPNSQKAEKIFEAPTWKEPFMKFHCVVPMTSFFESCRERGLAKGHEVSFFEKEEDSVMFGAGIYSIWKAKDNLKTVYSFSIITTEPTEFIDSVGHDRMPVFLDVESCKVWLENDFKEPQNAYDFLKDSKKEPDIDYKIIRQLKGA